MKIITVLLIIFFLSACNAGSGEGLNEQGQPISENDDSSTDPENDTIPATLTAIQENIFTPICSTCHGGVSPAAGQNLSSIEKSAENLINVSSSNALFKRVEPGEPEQSYLYLKITGNVIAGSRMPLGQPTLSAAQIAAIEQWISQGAMLPDNSNMSARVSKVTVDANREQNQSVLISFWFNKAMDFSTLTEQQILLNARSVNDDSWLYANEHLSFNIINEHVLQIEVSGISADIVQLNIELNNSSISTITSALGQVLDGDFDGIDGGEFNYDVILQSRAF